MDITANRILEYRAIREDILRGIDEMASTERLLVLGEELPRAERALAAYSGREYAKGVGNGTDAIYAALRALGITRRNRIIMPANVCVAVLEAVVRTGARPHYVDIEPERWTLDPSLVADALDPDAGAILAVHAYGTPADLDSLIAVGDEASVPVVGICGQAFGAKYRKKSVGAYGAAACYSFNPTKINGALGDGGAVVTNSEELAMDVHRIRDHGRNREGGPAQFVGISSRLDEINAMTVRLKLSHVDEWIRKRAERAARYRSILKEIDGIQLQDIPQECSPSHMITIRVDGPGRDRLQSLMADRGIRVGVNYRLPFKMPGYLHVEDFGRDDIPETVALEATTLTLPFSNEIADEEIERVTDALRECTQLVAT